MTPYNMSRGLWGGRCAIAFALHVPDLTEAVDATQASAPQSAEVLGHRNVRFRPVAVYPWMERDSVAALGLTRLPTTTSSMRCGVMRKTSTSGFRRARRA